MSEIFQVQLQHHGSGSAPVGVYNTPEAVEVVTAGLQETAWSMTSPRYVTVGVVSTSCPYRVSCHGSSTCLGFWLRDTVFLPESRKTVKQGKRHKQHCQWPSGAPSPVCGVFPCGSKPTGRRRQRRHLGGWEGWSWSMAATSATIARLKRSGLISPPCGTPLVTGLGELGTSPTRTMRVRPRR